MDNYEAWGYCHQSSIVNHQPSLLYKLAHFIRDKFPFVWDWIGILNSFLFSLRYGSRIKNLKEIKSIPDGYRLVAMPDMSTVEIVEFFARQPKEAFKYFEPHGFDRNSVEKLQKNKSFLAYFLIDASNEKIAGYCFNQSFFHGKGFRGRMVDINYRGKGLGTAMNRILNEIGFGIGLRLFEKVSRDNVASYRATVSSSNFKIIEELPGNRVFLEIMHNS